MDLTDDWNPRTVDKLNYDLKSLKLGIDNALRKLESNDYSENEHGIPAGGNQSQVLAKASVTDYDVHWVDQSGGGGSQQQSDWAETDNTKVTFIKNKPSLAAVATSGDYDDLIDKPTIPAAQVQSDWSQSDNTKVDYIKSKPNLATVATSGLYSDLSGTPSLAAVAISGDYDDLTDKPTIPAAGLPSGGVSGQYLTKSSNTDYDVGWTTGGGGGISLLDVYPVGSIYMSINSTDPGVLFGGTWQRIQDTFLLAAGSTYTAGDTGGSPDAIVPYHRHVWSGGTRFVVYTPSSSTSTGQSRVRVASSSSGSYYTNYSSDSAVDYSGVTNTAYAGTSGNATGANMPPYLAVYVWQRTA